MLWLGASHLAPGDLARGTSGVERNVSEHLPLPFLQAKLSFPSVDPAVSPYKSFLIVKEHIGLF